MTEQDPSGPSFSQRSTRIISAQGSSLQQARSRLSPNFRTSEDLEDLEPIFLVLRRLEHSTQTSSSSFTLTSPDLPSSPSRLVTNMFSRALRIPRAVPLRARPSMPLAAARRTVTTNAASAQVDKSAVPQVSCAAVRWPRKNQPSPSRASLEVFLQFMPKSGTNWRGTTSRTTRNSQSTSAMRASRPMSWTHQPTPLRSPRGN